MKIMINYEILYLMGDSINYFTFNIDNVKK